MLQWIGILVAVLGLAYTGVKDYQKGDIKLPQIKKSLTAVKHPIQYCLMAYDPNLDKVFYLHDNGQWHDYAPQQRRYAAPQEYYQDQGEKVLATGNGPSGGSRQYNYGQQAQAYAYPSRY